MIKIDGYKNSNLIFKNNKQANPIKQSNIPFSRGNINTDNTNNTKNIKKNNILKAAGLAIGVIAIGTAFVKRNKIAQFFTNLSKKIVKNNASQTISDKINSQDKFPQPKFGLKPTDKKKSAYIDMLKEKGYFVSNNDDFIDMAIDAVGKYGSGEDLAKIHSSVWTNAAINKNEERLQKLIHTTEKIGRKDKDSYHLLRLIGHGNEMKYSIETETELLKAIPNLFSNFDKSGLRYIELVKFANRIPEDKTGEYTAAYINMISKTGTKRETVELTDYLWDSAYNRHNIFIQNGQKTPQSVSDAIEKAKEKLLLKK